MSDPSCVSGAPSPNVADGGTMPHFHLFDIMFSTFGSVLKRGIEHTLQEEDTIDLMPSEVPHVTRDLLGEAWERRKRSGRPSLSWSIWDTYKGMLLVTGIVHVFDIGLLFVSPPLISALITELETGSSSISTGIACALGLCVCPIIQLMASNHFEMGTRRLGMRCMGGMSCLLFEKIVRLSQPANTLYGPGKLANIMQVDTARFMDCFFFVHFLWSMPMMLLLACAMTYQQLGWAAIMPLVIMAAMYPLNKTMVKNLMTLTQDISKRRDARVKVITEVLHAVRLCKMLGWEQQVADMVEEKRSSELLQIGRVKYWQVLIACIWGGGTAAILQFCTFAVYVLLGGELSAALVFSSLALFDLLQVPMNLFPTTFQFLVGMQVGVRRIEKLLLSEEVHFATPDEAEHGSSAGPSYVRCGRKSEDTTAATPIRITKAAFKWAKVAEDADSDEEQESRRQRCVKWFRREAVTERAARAAPLLDEQSMISIAAVPAVSTNITLSVPVMEVLRGKLVFVCGPVGAGKSTLISGLLGEVPQLAGRVELLGTVGYCAQIPWIMQGTVRDNILCGVTFDSAKFEAVIKACALETDLRQLDKGAATIIGERGINLSGGQKARIGLARAAYASASLYLLDDPLSAVDAHVAGHLMKECLGSENGYLKRTTRILATHQVQFMKHADVLVLMRDGEVVSARSPSSYSDEELKAAGLDPGAHAAQAEPDGKAEALVASPARPTMARQLSCNSSSGRTTPLAPSNMEGIGSTVPFRLPDCSGSTIDSFKLTASKFDPIMGPPRLMRSASNPLDDSERAQLRPTFQRSVTAPVHSRHVTGPNALRRAEPLLEDAPSVVDAERQLSLEVTEHAETEEQEEDSEQGSVSTRVWCLFAVELGLGWLCVVLVMTVLLCACTLGSTIWLGRWATITDGMNIWVGLTIYCSFSLGTLVCIASRIIIFRAASMRVSRTLHASAFWAVLRSPMSWLDTTPTGRLINRFSQDLQRVDMELQMSMLYFIRSIFELLAAALVVTAIVPVLLIAFVPTLFFYNRVQNIYRASARELRRLASKTKSPIFQGLDEAIGGVATIRAFRKQDFFCAKNAMRVKRNLKLEFTQMGCQRWLAVRLRMLGCFISSTIAVLVVLHDYLGPLGRSVSGAAAGIALRYAGSLTGSMMGILNTLTTVEVGLVAVERLTTFKELPAEAELTEAEDKPRAEWPTKGEIVFENVTMRYRPELDPVLRGMTFTLSGGSSLGIVGRTGAGKSSCLQALFRMCPLDSGKVYIDGVDISKIGLHTLRKRLAIIPQDPVGFTGSVRFNLDPFNERDDESIWRDLAKVQMKSFFEAKDEGLNYQLAAGGENLSVGQRQLLCAARAFLRGCQILVLDEATASVDFATDALIQEVLSNEVSSRKLTTLTIAHRINTILGCDRVMVVANGQVAEFGTVTQLAEDPSTLFYTFVNPSARKE